MSAASDADAIAWGEAALRNDDGDDEGDEGVPDGDDTAEMSRKLPPQDFSDPNCIYVVRYLRGRKKEWGSFDCSTSSIAAFHPKLRAGSRVRVRGGLLSQHRSRAIIIGVCDGLLWYHEEGAIGASAFLVKSAAELERLYALEILEFEPRAHLQHVVTMAARDFAAAGNGDGSGVESTLNHRVATAKAKRTWFPTKTGHSLFDHSAEEDQAMHVATFMTKSRAANAVFGHQKLPFVFFAPLTAKDVQRGNDSQLFPMLSEYDISAAGMQPFKSFHHGQVILLRKGPRAGRVVVVLGVLQGRLVLHEDGGFPMECDSTHNPLASMDPVPLSNVDYVGHLRSLAYLWPAPTVLLRAKTAVNVVTPAAAEVASKDTLAATTDDTADDQRPELQLTMPTSTMTCDGQKFYISAPHIFYRFGWLPLCRVQHTKGPLAGTTGLILGTVVEDGDTLWQYDEVRRCCHALSGGTRAAIDAAHGFELVGFRLSFHSEAGATGDVDQPWVDTLFQRCHTDAESVSNALQFRRLTRGSMRKSVLLASPPATTMRPPPALAQQTRFLFRCVIPSALWDKYQRSLGAASPPRANRRSTLAVHSLPTISVGAPSPTKIADEQPSPWVSAVVALETRWSTVARYGFGPHGSVVQLLVGERFNKVGVVMGVFMNRLFVLFDHERGAEPLPELSEAVRSLPHIAPKPILFAPSPKPVLKQTVVTAQGILLDVDCSHVATWRLGLVHGQRLLVAVRSDPHFQPVSRSQALMLHPSERYARLGLRTGTVAGVYRGELFVLMDDTKVAEPLLGMSEAECLTNHTWHVFDVVEDWQQAKLYPDDECLGSDISSATGAQGFVRSLPAMHDTLTAYRLTYAPLAHLSSQQSRDGSGAPPVAPKIATLWTSVGSMIRCLGCGEGRSISFGEKVSNVDGLTLWTEAVNRKLAMLSDDAPVLRLRRQQRIDPVRRSMKDGRKGKQWTAFGPDELCTLVGVDEHETVFACFDDDPRYLRPVPAAYEATLLIVPRSNPTMQLEHSVEGVITLAAPPAIPVVFLDTFQSQIPHEHAIKRFHELRALLNPTDPSHDAKGQNNTSQQRGKGLNRARRRDGAKELIHDDHDELREYAAKVLCDDFEIRETVRCGHVSEEETREVRLRCETLPKGGELFQILDWVLSCHGVRLLQGETLDYAFRLLAAVVRVVQASNRESFARNGISVDQQEPELDFIMPTVSQWCVHQINALIDRETGDRNNATIRERHEREAILFSERQRRDHIQSIFDEDDEDAMPLMDGHRDRNGGGLLLMEDDGPTGGLNSADVRPSAAGSTQSSPRHLSRKGTGNLTKIFTNKWRRCLDADLLTSVSSAAFLPKSMQDRILLQHDKASSLSRTTTSDSPPWSPRAANVASQMNAVRQEADACAVEAADNSDDSADEEDEREVATSTSGAITRLEQLQTMAGLGWTMPYVTFSGSTMVFDISVHACEPFGLFHGQVYETNRGDTTGDVLVILGVFRRRLWRYSLQGEAMPFDAMDAESVMEQHRLVLIATLPHDHVRRSDPFVFPTHKKTLVRLDVSSKATEPFGVVFGQRFLVMAKRPAAVLEMDMQQSQSQSNSSYGDSSASTLTSAPSGGRWVMVVILGVCEGGLLWISNTHCCCARPYTAIGGRLNIQEEWQLVFQFTAPVNATSALRRLQGPDGTFTVPFELPAEKKKGGNSAQDRDALPPPTDVPPAILFGVDTRRMLSRHVAALLSLSSSMIRSALTLPLVRQVRQLRFRNKAGEILTFDASPQAVGVFGFASGDRLLYCKPAKLCGKVCIVIGVRDKRLWKLEERDEGATPLGNCRTAAEVKKEFAMKVAGRQALREFTS